MTHRRKIRAEFRKNRTGRTRRSDWTQQFESHRFEDQDPETGERIGKNELTRKRTVCADGEGDPGLPVRLQVDEAVCRPGRVLSVRGLLSEVQADDGAVFICATRRLLKTLSTDQRHVVAAGDRVYFRPADSRDPENREGIIERIEARQGTVCRATRGRQHVLVANVDQLLIVTSAAEPRLKPHFVDRLLLTAEKGRVRPVVCVNKIDLVDAAELQPLVGVFSRMGYQVVLLSAVSGFGIDRLRRILAGHASVVAGQSGVGKSSLLNAVDPGLSLPVKTVSQENQKGRHTTTTACLLPLASGGYVVDTPGVRQFELWDVAPAEVAGFFRDLRPYVHLCRFPDCTHRHEADCAVKDAVADGRLDERRYESYCQMFEGDMEAN